MKRTYYLLILLIFIIVSIEEPYTSARGAETKPIDITSMIVNFSGPDAIVTVNYDYGRLGRLYLEIFGSKSIEPKINDFFNEFDHDIVKINYNTSIVILHNVSKKSGEYYLHNSVKFKKTIKILYVIIPDPEEERIYYDTNMTPNIFYR